MRTMTWSAIDILNLTSWIRVALWSMVVSCWYCCGPMKHWSIPKWRQSHRGRQRMHTYTILHYALPNVACLIMISLHTCKTLRIQHSHSRIEPEVLRLSVTCQRVRQTRRHPHKPMVWWRLHQSPVNINCRQRTIVLRLMYYCRWHKLTSLISWTGCPIPCIVGGLITSLAPTIFVHY